MSHVSKALRRVVALRANRLCEYCLVHEGDTFFGCEVDHIISKKHGGTSEEGNLAYVCGFCNRFKGSDIGSVLWETGEFNLFFNPRLDRWADHFRLEGITIVPLTATGEVTARILGFNDDDRLQERKLLQRFGRFPSPEAQLHLMR